MKIGDKVVWRSQAHGNWKTKTGTIVAVVPIRVDAWDVAPMDCYLSDPGMSRNHESYLVQVGDSNRLYWPRVSGLSLVKESKR